MISKFIFAFAMGIMVSCNQSTKEPKEDSAMVKLITLDPGHFHAALVQKTMYAGVDSVVHVYAPEGNDLQWHLDRINAFNTRKDDPTHWNEDIYKGDDYFEKNAGGEKRKYCSAGRKQPEENRIHCSVAGSRIECVVG
ncbi:MAG: hypothetical protein WDO16_03000 [Bacteroidota bacterium]